MTTHILSMTYGPKIEGVRNGTIRQTIRRYNPKRPFVEGDKLLIHGWEGRMYHSPWSWRIEAEIVQVMEIGCRKGCLESLSFGVENKTLWNWEDETGVAYILAEHDGIDPPTGMALKEVLEKFHGKFTDEPVRFQVIRW